MVGFGRKKSNSLFGDVDRKGKIDGSSLLDGDGEPTTGTLFESDRQNKKEKRVVDNQDDVEEQGEKKPSRSWFGFRRSKK
ncbi:hypothetical protein Ae201684P_002898 [Aphanomyces euteiches]|uniref:Uncharacterized protein n=1 Tax=Aphanomyces euteiches TaxID=100861 RepID=A0A6G0X596_9STRA|nr:hypothetical protein Ae201684_008450 [Aphanomyces euteiches]KAH9070541.1 hypothetical protein Ae201684P_002898 [Aphanomyces euteiches]